MDVPYGKSANRCSRIIFGLFSFLIIPNSNPVNRFLILTTRLIYKYTLQRVYVQRWHQTHTIRNMFDSEVSCCIYKKKTNKTEEQTKQTHNFLVSILVLACDAYLFCDSCISWVIKSRNQHQHHMYINYLCIWYTYIHTYNELYTGIKTQNLFSSRP